MSQNVASVVAQPNQMTFADLKKIANELGTEAGKGKDTRIKFQMKLVEAAFYNSIDLVADKHGKDKDDAAALTEEYVKAQSGSSFFDAKAPNQRKEISCSRTAIKLGQWPNGGPGEPLASMNNLITEWGRLKKNPGALAGGKLDDASNVLMKFARQQIKRDSVLDKAELHDLCFRKQSQERSVEQRLDSVRKEIDKIRKLDSSSHLVLAAKEITKRLEAIAQEKKKQAAAQQAARKAHSSQQAKPAGAAATS